MGNRVPKDRKPFRPHEETSFTKTVYKTNRYDLFEFFPENRPIEERHIRKQMIALQKLKGWHRDMPMKVVKKGGKLYILDAQHRFIAAQRLGIHIWYEVVWDSELKPEDFNAVQAAWNLRAFIHSKVAVGNDEYSALKDFIERFAIQPGIAASLLIGHSNSSSTQVTGKVKDGSFAVVAPEYADQVGELVKGIAEVFPQVRVGKSISALARFVMVDQFDAAHLIRQCQRNPTMLMPCATLNQYSEMYETVYNHMKRQRIPLKFLADEAAAGRNVSLNGNKSKQT